MNLIDQPCMVCGAPADHFDSDGEPACADCVETFAGLPALTEAKS